MWNFELSSIRKILISVLIFLSGCVYGQDYPGLNFAEQLKRIIVEGDVENFVNLPCFPRECVREEELDYVFGENRMDGFIKEFLRNPNIEIKIFGPFQYSDESEGGEYVAMYFDPEIVKFNSEGFLSSEDRERLWWNGYIETVIKNENGQWGFYRVPFYYGANLPWAPDY